jgi:hypothetical protein
MTWYIFAHFRLFYERPQTMGLSVHSSAADQFIWNLVGAPQKFNQDSLLKLSHIFCTAPNEIECALFNGRSIHLKSRWLSSQLRPCPYEPKETLAIARAPLFNKKPTLFWIHPLFFERTKIGLRYQTRGTIQ